MSRLGRLAVTARVAEPVRRRQFTRQPAENLEPLAGTALRQLAQLVGIVRAAEHDDLARALQVEQRLGLEA